ncbi:hypothetical protein Q8W71_09310 [Methylobacterium sp. NEAU 140]|uniref:hypothetical protein n=1 Tax=Methylobacterium sp. NEAU 140 TaxID=3064945 RepID=UPI0027356CDA|nr:hypothetical protein [Methylobacterium sp. NEAU 140]MDP4022818.1 hypothetical protein [Methylobacterium sp. NEAU 140]
MRSLSITEAPAAGAARPGLARPNLARANPARSWLTGLTALALLAAGAVAVRAPAVAVDPDLARVIRAMALIKGGFALVALAGAWWRLARPAAAWRTAVYVAGPPLMAAGAVALWSLHGFGVAALGLHLGLFALLAAALTDPGFLDGVSRRRI